MFIKIYRINTTLKFKNYLFIYFSSSYKNATKWKNHLIYLSIVIFKNQTDIESPKGVSKSHETRLCVINISIQVFYFYSKFEVIKKYFVLGKKIETCKFIPEGYSMFFFFFNFDSIF